MRWSKTKEHDIGKRTTNQKMYGGLKKFHKIWGLIEEFDFEMSETLELEETVIFKT